MKKSLFFVLPIFVLATPNVFAQYVNLNGIGLYGASQPCPYTASGGSAQAKLDKLDEVIDNLKDKKQALIDQDDDDFKSLDQDRLPFKRNVASELAKIIEAKVWNKTEPVCPGTCTDDAGFKTKHPLECSLSTQHCDGNVFNLNDVCGEVGQGVGSTGIYKIDEDKDTSDYPDKCRRWVSTYTRIEKKIKDLEVKRKTLQKKADKEEDRDQDRELSAMLGERYHEHYDSSIQAGVCIDGSCEDNDDNKSSFSKMFPWLLGGSILLDGFNMRQAYLANNRYGKQAQALGYPYYPGALPQASTTQSLLMAYAIAGRGSGSFACQAGMPGFGAGVNGIYGPMGNMSPYGNCGGAILSACSGNFGGMGYPMPFNPYAGGGIYAMGGAPGFMPGIPFPGGVPGGFPGGYPGAIPGYGGYPGFGGGLPGAYGPGGYPMGGLGMMGPGGFGGGFGMGPGMMGPGRFGGGYPMGGFQGTIPGAFGGPFGIRGPGGFGGGFGGPFGMGPGMMGPGGFGGGFGMGGGFGGMPGGGFSAMPGYPLGQNAFGNPYGGNPMGMFGGANPFANPIFAAGYSAGWTDATRGSYGGYGYGGGFGGYYGVGGYGNGYFGGNGGISFGITAPIGGR